MPNAHDTTELLDLCGAAMTLAEQLVETSRHPVAQLVTKNGKPDAALIDTHQLAAHGFAWQATYIEALRQTLGWAHALHAAGNLTDVEAAILRLGFAEYLSQLAGGIPISQTEMIRPTDIGVPAQAILGLLTNPVLAVLSDPVPLNAARQCLATAAID